MSRSIRKSSRLPLRTTQPTENQEDDLKAVTRLPTLTPRATDGGIRSTPHNRQSPRTDLRQLVDAKQNPFIPLARPIGTETASPNNYADETFPLQVRTPSLRRAFRVVPRKQGPPTTPHAIRALQQRRGAALTPGRDRRRSGRLQRETPRNVLRNLSRILASSSQQIEPLTQLPSRAREDPIGIDHDEFEMGPDPPMPRLSTAIEEYNDEDSFKTPVPRTSVPFDEDLQTQHSVEMLRKAYSEQPIGRLSRGSFGSIRVSDRFTDLNDTPYEAMSDDIANGDPQSPRWEDNEASEQFGQLLDSGGDTEILRGALLDRNRRQSSSQSSVRREQMFQIDDNLTFAFDIPDEQDEHIPRSESRQNRFLSPEKSPPIEIAQMMVKQPSVRPNPMRSRETKAQKKSRYGISYPSLAPGVVKKLVASFARSSGSSKVLVNKAVISSIMQASDWFFEQIGDDLGTYAKHASRKTIDESDIMTLMKRQRLLSATTTTFSLAEKYLPKELLQEIRMVPPTLSRLRR